MRENTEENNTPILESAVFEFTQDGNCLEKREAFETIQIEYKSSLGLDRDGDGFYTLITERWSIDSVEDLEKMFNRIKKIMEK